MVSAILDTVLTIADTRSMIFTPLRYGAVRGAETTGRGEHGSVRLRPADRPVRPGSAADHRCHAGAESGTRTGGTVRPPRVVGARGGDGGQPARRHRGRRRGRSFRRAPAARSAHRPGSGQATWRE